MGNHIQEFDIELTILEPGKVSDSRRNEIAHHLRECSACREIAVMLQSFYSELNTETTESPRVEEFLESLTGKPVIIQLHPYQFSPDPSEFGEHVMTVLAAKSETVSNYRYSAVCTLVSRDENTLVRILKDNEALVYRLFLILRRRQPSQRISVRFPTLDLEIPIDPDSLQADIRLPANRGTVDWTNIVAELIFCQT
jgi:hypothetical protein